MSAALFSGVVLDADRDQVFLMVDDGIAAVHAPTGKRLWTSQSAAKPMAVQDDRLAVIGASETPGGIAVLDAKTGRRAATCNEPVPSTHFQLTNSLGVNVSSHGTVHNDQVMLTWIQQTYYAGGAAPTPQREAASRTHTTGTVALDMASGCYEEAAPPSLPEQPLLQVSGTPKRMGPWKIRGTKVHIETEDVDGTREVRLIRTVRGTPHTQTVATGRPGSLGAMFTEDGEAMLITRQNSSPERGYGFDWRLVDLRTGEVTDYGWHAFLPGGVDRIGRVLVAVQAQVVGVAPGGKVLWTETLRSTGYTGPYPP